MCTKFYICEEEESTQMYLIWIQPLGTSPRILLISVCQYLQTFNVLPQKYLDQSDKFLGDLLEIMASNNCMSWPMAQIAGGIGIQICCRPIRTQELIFCLFWLLKDRTKILVLREAGERAIGLANLSQQKRLFYTVHIATNRMPLRHVQQSARVSLV